MILSFGNPRINVSGNFGEQLLRKISVLHTWFKFNPTRVYLEKEKIIKHNLFNYLLWMVFKK